MGKDVFIRYFVFQHALAEGAWLICEGACSDMGVQSFEE